MAGERQPNECPISTAHMQIERRFAGNLCALLRCSALGCQPGVLSAAMSGDHGLLFCDAIRRSLLRQVLAGLQAIEQARAPPGTARRRLQSAN